MAKVRHLFTNGLIRDSSFEREFVDHFGLQNIGKMDDGDTRLKENVWIDAGTERELSVPSKSSRVTPRNSVAGRPSLMAPKPTPHATVGIAWHYQGLLLIKRAV